MNANRIYTRKTLELDNRVWMSMFAVISLSLGLLGYRIVNKKECTPFKFEVINLALHDSVFYVGDNLSFTASISSKDIDWSFGDNTGESGPVVHHQFLKEGTYLIKASGNSLCEVEKEIRIQAAPPVVQTSDFSGGKIVGTASFYTYTDQVFSYPVQAKSYEWTVQNHPIFGTERGQTVHFKFLLPGSYKIQVVLDNDFRKTDYFDVEVEDEVKPKTKINENIPELIKPISKPQQQIPVPKPLESTDSVTSKPSHKKLIISDISFLNYLQEIQNGDMMAQDFEDKYLCGGGSTKVTVNDKEHTNFSKLCEEINKKSKSWILGRKKAITLTEVVTHRDNDCITLIEVKYK